MTWEARKISYEFTSEEIKEKGQAMAALHVDLVRLNMERKAAADKYKRLIGDAEARIMELTRQINDGYEYREHRCTHRLDRETKERVWLDIETNAEVERTPFEPEDYQIGLDEAEAPEDEQAREVVTEGAGDPLYPTVAEETAAEEEETGG